MLSSISSAENLVAKISVERLHLFPTLFYKVKLPLPYEEMAEDLIKYHNDNTEEHQTAHNFDFQRESNHVLF